MRYKIRHVIRPVYYKRYSADNKLGSKNKEKTREDKGKTRRRQGKARW